MLSRRTCARIALQLTLALVGSPACFSEEAPPSVVPQRSPPFIAFKKNSVAYADASAEVNLRQFFTNYKSLKSEALSISISYVICEDEKAFDRMLAYHRIEKILAYAQKSYGIGRMTFTVRDVSENTITGPNCTESGLRLSVHR